MCSNERRAGGTRKRGIAKKRTTTEGIYPCASIEEERTVRTKFGLVGRVGVSPLSKSPTKMRVVSCVRKVIRVLTTFAWPAFVAA